LSINICCNKKMCTYHNRQKSHWVRTEVTINYQSKSHIGHSTTRISQNPWTLFQSRTACSRL